MRIYGLDFTSAPGRRKPITCAVCELHNNLLYQIRLNSDQKGVQGSPLAGFGVSPNNTISTDLILQVNDSWKMNSFAEFEAFLNLPGPWLAALDFPFGLPAKLLSNLGWPETWEDYIRIIASMDKMVFEEALLNYSRSRPPGDKLHLRATDGLARARSPMMLHRVPVGKMFFQGAPRLLASGVSILPCHPANDSRIVVEGYPALVARKWIGKLAYKSDVPGKQTPGKEEVRHRLLAVLRSQEQFASYGFSVELFDTVADSLIQDPMGDYLDALLCAVQAAWVYTQRDNNYGIPSECNKDEGWIVDPAMINIHAKPQGS